MTADNGPALIIGVGSPVVDMVARVSEVSSSRTGGAKGGMQNAGEIRNENIRCKPYSCWVLS